MVTSIHLWYITYKLLKYAIKKLLHTSMFYYFYKIPQASSNKMIHKWSGVVHVLSEKEHHFWWYHAWTYLVFLKPTSDTWVHLSRAWYSSLDRNIHSKILLILPTHVQLIAPIKINSCHEHITCILKQNNVR